MNPGKRADRNWLAGSAIYWPTLRRTAGPLPSEMVFRSPGLELLARQISNVQRANVLDLGSPRAANIAYFSQFSCVLHIEDLPRALADDPGMSAPEEERDVEGVVGRLITHRDGIRFDAVFVWDLFDYLDALMIRAIMCRIGHCCRTGTLLFMMTSNRETIPDEPGRFTIVDEQHLHFERVGMGTRNGVNHSPRGLERIMPGFHLQHSFLLGNDMQDYLFSHD